jgi:DNA-binding transcriptional regulator YiaG
MPDNRLTALQARLSLPPAAMARYLGVPRPTWDKWERGEREPPAALWRLVEVLGLVEMLAPDLHNLLINRE